MVAKDRLLRVLTVDGGARAILVTATRTVETARRRHGTYPVATAALGRTLVAALMLASTLKEGEHVTVRVLGDGPLGAIVADADGFGNVRGYVQEPRLLLPLNAIGKLDVGRAVGHKGILAVSRETLSGVPYASSAPLVSGEIGEDLARYLWVSEQTPSAVSVGVQVDERGRVVGAGGVLVQLLPGGGGAAAELEAGLRALGPVSDAVRSGMSLEAMADRVLGAGRWKALEERPLRFRCTCTPARMRRALVALGREEIESILREEGRAEVRCHFCNRTYEVRAEELERLLARLGRDDAKR
jgi:molecular chaperone Hsp33